MILARCATYFHLFNLIQLKLTLLKDQDVDIVLSLDTDFSFHENSLKESGLFHRVIRSDVSNILWTKEFNECSEENRESWFLDKLKQSCGSIPDEDYSDFYFGMDDAYNKFLYYCMVEMGMRPALHMFDEGTASYVLPFTKRIQVDHIPHSHFGEQAFLKNIKELLLYAPELRSGNLPFPVNKIPSIDRNSSEVRKIFNMIFGYKPGLTLRRYIYFEGGCFNDNMGTMDIDILNQVAEIIGKDNIAVKLHPRTVNDRFTRRGYYVMPNQNIPWEMYAINEELENHVYISNSSTAALTTRTIFGINTFTVNLFNLDLLEHTLYTRQKNFSGSYKLQEQLFNKDGICFFSPKNANELKVILKYLEGK